MHISIIIPVFNNERVLPQTISILSEYFSRQNEDYEMIFVDDCSTDGSAQILQDAETEISQIRVCTHLQNLGQQKAVATGLLVSTGDVAVTADADLPCSPPELRRVALLAMAGKADLILGVRTDWVHGSIWRRWASRLGNWTFRMIYSYKIRDFGCGTGAARRSLLEKLRLRHAPVRIIKLELLRLADSYQETEVQGRPYSGASKSSYTILKLLKLFWLILASRI